MELVTPDIGMVFWTSVTFLLLVFLLGKFAWKPIIGAINEREQSIDQALRKAESAKQEMAQLTKENDELLKAARAERDLILKEAKELKEQIVKDAKTKAQEEGAKMIEKAKLEIDHQKVLAMTEVKSQVSTLALDIARKVLHEGYKDKANQNDLVNDLLKDLKLN